MLLDWRKERIFYKLKWFYLFLVKQRGLNVCHQSGSWSTGHQSLSSQYLMNPLLDITSPNMIQKLLLEMGLWSKVNVKLLVLRLGRRWLFLTVPWGTGWEKVLCRKRRCFGRDPVNRGPVSQQVWYDQYPFLLEGLRHRSYRIIQTRRLTEESGWILH